ncbi:MAG: methylated-DNA--[protein]-cysteine S-methyltransferase [Cytophagaceae bacterium]|jgi:AraC family transcriptional regulator of adaptative response/methylated-DNA-[protein]-cysteine methyltransferase|nr:methylated-DNA--[protein]-cysteine S-methyltransferase [Cytophagaceae bacterium]
MVQLYDLSPSPKCLRYGSYSTRFGKILIASINEGICFCSLQEEQAEEQLRQEFPKSIFRQEKTDWHQLAIQYLESQSSEQITLPVFVNASSFQLRVWQLLLSIEMGQCATYKEIAERLGVPGASRAVGSAIGKNPVALFIPCHRVVQTGGGLGGFRWGLEHKKRLLAQEALWRHALDNN